MYVIAGLPITRLNPTLDMMGRRFPHAIFKGLASPTQDGALYSRVLLDQLARAVGQFAVRRRKKDPAQPTPASLVLLFVPAPDQELLLRMFDFAAMVSPLSSLVRQEDGRPLRHRQDAVEAALIEALKPSGEAEMALMEVKRRLGYMSDNEALLLPPHNFLTKDGNLTPVFRAFRNRERDWSDRLEEYGPTDLQFENVPKRIAPQRTRRPFVDQRKMAFFMAHPKAFDGPAREREDPEDALAILDALRSLYRFGGALAPGLHHDAQHADGSDLGGALFNCSTKGPIHGLADYANVYPNDFVRVSKFKKAE